MRAGLLWVRVQILRQIEADNIRETQSPGRLRHVSLLRVESWRRLRHVYLLGPLEGLRSRLRWDNLLRTRSPGRVR